jgi:hypothetical protein
MAEQKRGCGYRKVGGLYLVGDGTGLPCCKLPIPLHVCPTCNNGIKQSRGWQWIDPRPWLQGPCTSGLGMSIACGAADPARLGERVGLIWIGAGFYPNAGDFIAEADRQGISRRIAGIPKGFELGQSWVFLAHPRAIPVIVEETSELQQRPGVFRIFRPTRLEKIVTQTQSQDEEAMGKLAKQGITPIIVDDDDRRHQGSVYDDGAIPEQQGELFA